jgi:hypothetical protein
VRRRWLGDGMPPRNTTAESSVDQLARWRAADRAAGGRPVCRSPCRHRCSYPSAVTTSSQCVASRRTAVVIRPPRGPVNSRASGRPRSGSVRRRTISRTSTTSGAGRARLLFMPLSTKPQKEAWSVGTQSRTTSGYLCRRPGSRTSHEHGEGTAPTGGTGDQSSDLKPPDQGA